MSLQQSKYNNCLRKVKYGIYAGPGTVFADLFIISPRGLIFFCILLIAGLARAQEDSLTPRETISSLRLNVKGSFIGSRAFSNYPLKNSSDDVSSTTYSKSDTGSKYFPGFDFGADVQFLSKESFKLFLGLTFSHTRARYHSSYVSEGPTSRTGFTKLSRRTENDYDLNFSALNFEAGMRKQVSEDFFFSGAFVLTSPLKIERTLTGYTETTYSNNSGGEEKDKIYNNEQTKLSQKPANLSLRFTTEYQFELGNSLARVYLYKNFGLLYALPWWGIGFSYTLH
jgi:hypothetical protein